MKVAFKKSFLKKFEKLDRHIQIKVTQKISIFQENPFQKNLNNHALVGEYMGFRSINITGDFRAIFIEKSNNTYDFVEFIDIGTHSALY